MSSTVMLNSTSLPEDYLLQKRLEIVMDTNNKRLFAELSSIKALMDKMSNEIREIQNTINTSLKRQAESDTRECKQVSLKNVSTEKESEPRYGSYKPEDVSITKFFYFGNKK